MAASDSGKLTLLCSQPLRLQQEDPAKYEMIAQTTNDEESPEEPKPRADKGPKSFWEEHWYRCPKRAAGEPSCTNLYGLMLRPFAVALQLFVAERCLTAYDSTADVIVISKVDRQQDPWWFRISVLLLIFPIGLKAFIFRKNFIRMLERLGLSNAASWTVYSTVGVLGMALSDYFLLIMYPWVRPSPGSGSFLLQFERLSGLIEGMVESTSQWAWQMYMYVRTKQLGRDSQASLEGFLLYSILPGMVSMAYKVYTLRKEARKVGLGLLEYVNELVKAPLGWGRAPFLELLSTRQEVSYEGLGPLTREHQNSIFEAIADREELPLADLSFDDGNDIDYVLCAPIIERNMSLEILSCGHSVTLPPVVKMLQCLEGHNMKLSIGTVEMSQAYRKRWLADAYKVLPEWYSEKPQGPFNVEHACFMLTDAEESALSELCQQIGCEIPPKSLVDDSSKLGHSYSVGEKMSGHGKYRCCVQAPDGMVYAIPDDAEQVLAFDPKTETSRLVGEKMSGDTKYGCCVQAPDGMVYAMPWNAEQVLAFDPKTETSRLVGEKMSGNYKYGCCVQAPDGMVYAMPLNAEQVLAFDPKSETSRLVGEKMSGDGKYICCVQAPDGMVYAMPWNPEQVLAFDPKTETSRLVGEKMSGSDKYRCCVQAPDGMVYAMPADAEQVLAFDPKTETSRLVGEKMSGDTKYGYCVQAPDGMVYAMPLNAEQVLAFDSTPQGRTGVL